MLKERIRWIDTKALFIIGICYIPAFIYRLFNRNIWLCSERKDEARDNGYWMYKYIRENHPEQKCYYVITKNSYDRKKIEQYKTLINWGSLRHYFMFIVTRVRLSAHVNADTPNFRVTNFLERHHLFTNKRVFLNHGIIKDKLSFVYFEVTKADLMTTTTKKEYDFCVEEYGYPKGNIKLLGCARYDGLVNKCDRKQILIVPTWRSWLSNVSEDEFRGDTYYLRYKSLLENNILKSIANSGVVIIFYLHSEMQRFSHLFTSVHPNIIIGDCASYDIQKLINSSSLMVTDYSSVAFDMAYLNKPIIYYHFDYRKYRDNQHKEGYFDYFKDGFGPVVEKEQLLVNIVESYIRNCIKINRLYRERIESFFTYYGNDNCFRIYNEIKKL